ncbi:MAG: hypothetical protein EAZ37_03205 [Burkholderiales bacterium]|nr:MAG: hypothetical protein EAZ37_03205 [Burkholderiales bacterium]
MTTLALFDQRLIRSDALLRILDIQGLPYPDELARLAKTGRLHLVNVSGNSLLEIYPELNLHGFELTETTFSDLFTQHPMIDRMSHPSSVDFVRCFPLEQQMAFKLAVSAACDILRTGSCGRVFCFHGVGRAPAVTLAALRCAWNLPLSDAVELIKIIRPQAHISELSLSAAQWCWERKL